MSADGPLREVQQNESLFRRLASHGHVAKRRVRNLRQTRRHKALAAWRAASGQEPVQSIYRVVGDLRIRVPAHGRGLHDKRVDVAVVGALAFLHTHAQRCEKGMFDLVRVQSSHVRI